MNGTNYFLKDESNQQGRHSKKCKHVACILIRND